MTLTRSAVTHLPHWLRGSVLIAVSMSVMNLTTYGFTMIAARVLGPDEYGALAAVMGVLLVVNVASLGLQATGARRVSAAGGSTTASERELLRATYRTALGLGALCLLLAPALTAALRLDSWVSAAMVAATAVPLTVMGGLAGILQGEQRWLPLAGVYLGVGLGRIGFGGLGLWLGGNTAAAMGGVAVGAVVPVLIGYAGLRRRAGHRRGGRPRGGLRDVMSELAHNSHALLAFFALSNADVVIARAALDDNSGGLYAGGLILAKAVLFLPQFVVVVAFPAMASSASRRLHLRGLALVLAIGASATGGAALLPGFAVQFIGGPAYAGLEPLIWGFAGIGTLLAMTQLMVYDLVAAQRRSAVVVVWLGLAALMTVVPWVDSVPALLTSVLALESLVLLILVLLSLRPRDLAHEAPGA